MTRSTSDLMTVAEVAAYIRKPPSWLWNNPTAIPRVRLGRQYRYRLADVEAFLDRNYQ